MLVIDIVVAMLLYLLASLSKVHNVLKRVETFGLVLPFARVLLTYRPAYTYSKEHRVLKCVEMFGLVLLFSRVLLTYRAAHTQRIEIC